MNREEKVIVKRQVPPEVIRAFGQVEESGNKATQRNTEPVMTSRFAMIDVKLVSRSLHPTDLNEMELKYFLLLCKMANDIGGETRIGCKYFNRYCSCTLDQHKTIQSQLVNKGLIKTVGRPWNVTETTVMMLPFPSYTDGSLSVIDDQPKTGHAFKKNKVHFIIVPNDALEIALGLCRNSLLVLLKLYRYNQFDVFGGVDPNVIRFENNQWIIDPRLWYDLYLTRDELIESLLDLEKAELILIKDVGLLQEDFDVEHRLRVAAGNTAKLIQPIYQWRKKTDEAGKRNSRRRLQ